ncbi:MAG TPA: class I SAM-dependent methyltransferase, partial [Nitrospira sp.]|nr:class I SAM-dependent methyltransferase [Nitrospira sp.]
MSADAGDAGRETAPRFGTAVKPPTPDLSNGYDDEAESFIAGRSPTVGASTVRSWARSLPPGIRVLEIGCGDGNPITWTLIDEGLNVLAVDASPKMVSAFRQNFPDTPVICEAAERLYDLDQRFDAAIAWGLLFLLTPETQQTVIHNIGNALNRGGRFLFTSPKEAVTWRDIRTGRESVSLGASGYRSLLSSASL